MVSIQHYFGDRCIRMAEGVANQKVLIFNNFKKERSGDKEERLNIYALETKLQLEIQACNNEVNYCLQYRA